MPPADFWQTTEAQLDETPVALSATRDDFYSQPEWDVYRLNYNSAGGHRLFAWLSVPKNAGDRPYPALLRMPDYASVHDLIYTPLRHHAIVMNATHRGQRHSDSIYRAQYPGLLTDGIADGESWAILGAYADALRAIDILLSQKIEEIARAEIGRIALSGGGLGATLALAAASQCHRIQAVAADTPLPLGHPAALDPALGYPLAEIADYLRQHPQHRPQVERTLSILNPLADADNIAAPTLLSAGRLDRSTSPAPFPQELANAIPNCDLRLYDHGAAEGGGHTHAQIRHTWLSQHLGLP